MRKATSPALRSTASELSAPPVVTRLLNKLAFAVMCVLCLGVAAYALVTYSLLPPGERLHPDMRATFLAHAWGIKTHVFASALALLLGPFQFSTRLRARHPQWHRWMGRVYLGGAVLIGGLAGLTMSTHAFGGWVSKTGFAGLALAWLATGWLAYQAIRRGDVVSHRRWMLRNFALTLAAVTLRIYLPIGFVLQVPFERMYPVIAWLCWVPNLLVAQWRLQRR